MIDVNVTGTWLGASDFPHADHTPAYVDDLNALVSSWPEEDRRRFVADNVRELFGIEV